MKLLQLLKIFQQIACRTGVMAARCQVGDEVTLLTQMLLALRDMSLGLRKMLTKDHFILGCGSAG